MHKDKGLAYCQLMRIDKPIGILLLLWPTLWALWLASAGVPTWHLFFVFMCGVVLMRSAGCVINDFADRHFDGHVERTQNRPLPCKKVSEKESKILFLVLVFLSFLLVLTLNSLTIILSLAALVLAWIYPFMKRVTHLPQLVLGMAFGWSIPMSYAAAQSALPLSCWLLFLANICWTIAYDTQYAMVDRDDDIKIDIKSTAILFGRFDKFMIGLLQLTTLLLLIWIGHLHQLSLIYFISLLIAMLLFIYQHILIAHRDRKNCFTAFLNNNYVGLIIFLGIAGSYLF